MASERLLQNLSSGTNHAMEAYDDRTATLQKQRDADFQKQRQMRADANTEIDRKDNEMHNVFKLAGNGFIEEARFFAQSKGLQVPEDIYKNADLAKGLALSKDMYPNDPENAQKFTMAWMQSDGDERQRVAKAQQIAGLARNPEDRQFDKQIALKQWEIQNEPPAGIREFNYYTSMPEDEQEQYRQFKSKFGDQGGMTEYQRATLQQRGAEYGNEMLMNKLKYVADRVQPFAERFDIPREEIEKLEAKYAEEYDRLFNTSPQPSSNLMSAPSSVYADPEAAHAAAVQNRQAEIGQNQYQREELSQESPLAQPSPNDVQFAGTTMINGARYNVYQDRRTGKQFYEADSASR
jgi:hypothetical protein